MKKTNFKAFTISSFVLIAIFSLFFVSNARVLAQDSSDPLVKCGTEKWPKDHMENGKNVGDTIKNPCEFKDIIDLINRAINFIFVNIVLPLSAIMFAYAGFLLVTSGGETSKKEKAKKIFTNVAIGLIVVVAAFLIVQTVLSVAGFRTDGDWNWFGFEENQ